MRREHCVNFGVAHIVIRKEALQLAGGYPRPEGNALLGAFILRENDILSAGNITHTPAYGNLIALGVLTGAQSRNASQHQVAEAVAYRELIARTGRFLTYCGGAPIIGQRMSPARATGSR
jgi:hypothetical protein